MIRHLEINSDKIKKEKIILLISDIHINIKNKNNNLFKLKQDLKEEFNKIDYILITGDIIDSPKYLTEKEYINKLLNYLEEFIEDKKTYAVLGNHDITSNNINTEYLFTILKEKSNIKCLDNKDVINLGDISIQGFSPSHSYYKEHKGNKYEFLKQFIEEKKDKFSKKTYNILLTHDPSSIIKLSKKEEKCIYENTDLVISGHMHNGLVPLKLQSIMHNHGLVGPYNTLFPRYSNGTIKIKNTNFIILGAVNPTINIPHINKAYGYDAIILSLKKVK